MSKVVASITTSVHGFITGPDDGDAAICIAHKKDLVVERTFLALQDVEIILRLYFSVFSRLLLSRGAVFGPHWHHKLLFDLMRDSTLRVCR